MVRKRSSLLKFIFLIVVFIIFLILIKLYFHEKPDKSLFKINLKNIQEIINKSTCNCRNKTIKITKSGNLIHINSEKNYWLTQNEFEESKIACDLEKVLQRGPNQKVISYSIFGSNSFYFRYLELISKTAQKLFPEWTIRFYHDSTFDQELLCKIECKYSNVDFCNTDKLLYEKFSVNFMIPTFWRWLPIGDTFVDVFLSRDSDFCLVERERDAVNEWLSLGTLFHVMRDHPLHDMFMLAGLWGFANGKDRNLALQVFNNIFNPALKRWHANYKNEKQADQIFLKKYLWETVQKNFTAHDSFHCLKYNSRPFPTQRPWFYCHVGGYGCCGIEILNSSFPHECPYECRPKEHKEWIFC